MSLSLSIDVPRAELDAELAAGEATGTVPAGGVTAFKALVAMFEAAGAPINGVKLAVSGTLAGPDRGATIVVSIT